MSNKNYSRLKDFLSGFALTAILSLPVLWHMGMFDKQPYTSVDILTITYNEDRDILFDASFYKSEDCEFVKLEVVAKDLGIWKPLSWSDPGGEQGDRLAGRQYLSLLINTNKTYYDEFEIRTRHICGGQRVDRVFVVFHEEDIHEEENVE